MNWYNYLKFKNIKIKRSNWFYRIIICKIRGNSIVLICILLVLCKFLERVLYINLIGMVFSKSGYIYVLVNEILCLFVECIVCIFL